jgi:hypothetical protein
MAEINEQITWYYDKIMMSKGNRVIVTAIHNDGAVSKTVDKDGNPPTYAPRLSPENAEKESGELFTQTKLEEFKQKFNNSESIKKKVCDSTTVSSNGIVKWKGTEGLTEEEYQSLGEYKVYFAPKGGSQRYTTTVDLTNADSSQESLIVSMSELSIGINNQWMEGNGVSGLFTGSIDAMAQLGTGRATAAVLEELERFNGSPGDSAKIQALKKMNQVHYRSSTQFVKAYAGTNISIPISITRTFVHDQYGITHDTDIAKMAKWGLGTELDIDQYTDTNDLISKLKTSSKEILGDVATRSGDYIDNVGGLYQKAPLGYIYSSQYWRKMVEDDGKVIGGTLVVTLPNGIKIPDLLVSDMSITMSNTQVLTKNGLRPLTITISVQLLPARVWGVKDALKMLGYRSVSVDQSGNKVGTGSPLSMTTESNSTNNSSNNSGGNSNQTSAGENSTGEEAAKRVQQQKANKSNTDSSNLPDYLKRTEVTTNPNILKPLVETARENNTSWDPNNFSQRFGS